MVLTWKCIIGICQIDTRRHQPDFTSHIINKKHNSINWIRIKCGSLNIYNITCCRSAPLWRLGCLTWVKASRWGRRLEGICFFQANKTALSLGVSVLHTVLNPKCFLTPHCSPFSIFEQKNLTLLADNECLECSKWSERKAETGSVNSVFYN